MNKILKADDVKREVRNDGAFMFKFVKVGSEFRYTELDTYGLQHNQLLQKGEKATAAGVVTAHTCGVKLTSNWSSTLKMNSGHEDLEDIAKELDLPALS